MQNRRWMSAAAVVLVAALALPLTALAKPPVRSDEVSTIFTSVITDVNGNPINFSTPPATPLYTAALGTPLLAPDGHQITWGEWLQGALSTESVVSVKCIQKGTHVTIEVTDLIPNALYSVWIFTIVAPGSPLSAGALPNLTGQGGNAFITDATGAGSFNTIAPAGPLSISGTIPACLLDNAVFVIQLAYHSDGQLYGGVPGPAGVTLDHINFVFQP